MQKRASCCRKVAVCAFVSLSVTFWYGDLIYRRNFLTALWLQQPRLITVTEQMRYRRCAFTDLFAWFDQVVINGFVSDNNNNNNNNNNNLFNQRLTDRRLVYTTASHRYGWMVGLSC